jgi:8-oxo-dGTP diphosphatase
MNRTVDAAVVLVVHEGRALVLRRRPDDRSFASMWCLPGGRIELGEAPHQAAVRETEEETGLRIEVRQSLGARAIHLAERQLIFHIHRFVARTAHAAVRLSDEHVDARWIDRDEARRAQELLPSGLAGEVTTELLARFAEGLELVAR